MGIENHFIRTLQEKVIICDGAMGTSIQSQNFSPDHFHGHTGCNDYLNLSAPSAISVIHEEFFNAGADVAETNTFGAHPLTLAEYGLGDKAYEINKAGATLAVQTAASFGMVGIDRFVAGSIGPGLKLPSLGHITFKELADGYYTQVCGLVDGGVHLFQVETCQDPLQIKSVLYAILRVFRERRIQLPIVVTATIQRNGTLLAGTDLEALAAICNPFPLTALGLNCSEGPAGLESAAKKLAAVSRFPLAILANAGLPQVKDGIFSYDLLPEDFACQSNEFIKYGARILGGCCGTTPKHIQALSDTVTGQKPVVFNQSAVSALASLYSAQPVDTEPKPLLIAERANATGSKVFRELVKSADYEGMVSFINGPDATGAHAVDISVAVPGRCERDDMDAFLARAVPATKLPFVIDSTDPEVIETALQRIGGRPVINSVNLEDADKARRLFELAYMYGAAIICLTIDENGMASTANMKTVVARKLYDLAVKEIGLRPDALLIDPLTFTIGTGDASSAGAAVETLNALREIKNICPGVSTILGVSNVSYGLDKGLRKIINAVFLRHAVNAGLDVAIADSGRIVPVASIEPEIVNLAEDVLFNRKPDALHRFIEKASAGSTSAEEHHASENPLDRLRDSVISGNVGRVEKDTGEAIDTDLAAVIPIILAAMEEVGGRFEAGTMQLPFVLRSAEAVQKAFAVLKKSVPTAEHGIRKKKIVLATVKGDIHDIGKNLVAIIMENSGFEVVDLGVDRSAMEICDAVQELQPDALGLSGLLVRSAHAMEEICRQFTQRGFSIPLLCGGAALSREFVSSSLRPLYVQTHYAHDAFEAIRVINNDTGVPLEYAAVVETLPPDPTPFPVDINDVMAIPVQPFSGVKTESFSPIEIVPYINSRALIENRWLYTSDKHRKIGKSLSEDLTARITENTLVSVKAVYGYFHCRSSNGNIEVLHADGTVAERLTVAAHNRSTLTRFIRKDRDLIAMYCVSADGAAYAADLFRQKKYHDYFLWHGFCAELAETAARLITQRIRMELGLDGHGKRYSFGYPACPDINQHAVLDRLLGFDAIGVTRTEMNALAPDTATAGFFLHHPQACYFTP